MGRQINVESFSASKPAPEGFRYLVIETVDQWDEASLHSYIRSDSRWTKLNAAVTGPTVITELKVGDFFLEGELEGERVVAIALLVTSDDDEE